MTNTNDPSANDIFSDKNRNVTQLLTSSIQERTSSEVIQFSASQEIPCILWNPKFHYCIYQCLPSAPILSQIYRAHAFHPLPQDPSQYYPPIYDKNVTNLKILEDYKYVGKEDQMVKSYLIQYQIYKSIKMYTDLPSCRISLKILGVYVKPWVRN